MNTETILLQATLEPCWLWWLILSALAFILGLLLGYLLFSNSKRLKELETDNADLKTRLIKTETDFVGLKYQYDEAQKDLSNMRVSLQRCQADKAVLSTKLEKALAAANEGNEPVVATRSFGAGMAAVPPPQSDDLTKIEGVGPKIQTLLNNIGIYTFADLAEATLEQLKAMLKEGGPAYTMADPATWPKQADLAAQGKWDELAVLQDRLKGGKESDA